MSKASKKDFIADAALTCFLSSSYGGTSVDDIVRATGISKGGLYWHFKSKEDIFLYLIEKWIKTYDQDLLARVSKECPFRDKLNKIVEYYLEHVDVPVVALLREFLTQAKDEIILNKLHGLISCSKRGSVLEKVIREAVWQGECKPVDVEAAAIAFIGMFEGIGILWSVSRHDKELFERTVKTALNIYLEGILN